MKTVTLTREFSGFANVQDTWLVGNDDSKAGTIGVYALPNGYHVGKNQAEDDAIFGADGYECEIIPHSSGRPQLLGGIKMPVLERAA